MRLGKSLKKACKSVTKTVTSTVKTVGKGVSNIAKSAKETLFGKTETVGQSFESAIVAWSKTQLQQAANSSKYSASQKTSIKKELERRTELEKTAAYTTDRKNLIESKVKNLANINTQNSFGYNLITSEDTEKSIYEDERIMNELEAIYKDVSLSQSDLETQAVTYTFPSLNSIDSSGAAEQAIQSVNQQISRLNALISSSSQVTKVLQKQKETVTQQLKARETELNKAQEEVQQLNARVQADMKAAQCETDNYVENIKTKTNLYKAEYQDGNYEQQGITLEDFLQQKLGSLSLPDSIGRYEGEAQQLSNQIAMKNDQITLISTAIGVLKNNLSTIDSRISTQDAKLKEYKTNLTAAEKYKESATKVKSEAQSVENSTYKSGGIVNNIANAVTKGVKAVVKTCQTVLSKTLKVVGDYYKSCFNVVGKALDKAELDNVGNDLKSLGKFAKGTTYTLAGVVNCDAKEIKDGFKKMKENAAASIRVATGLSQVSDALVGTGSALDHAGIDSLGNTVKATGKFVDGTSELITGSLTLDKKTIKDGIDKVEKNILPAGLLALDLVSFTYSAGAFSPTTVGTWISKNVLGGAAYETTKSVTGSQTLATTAKIVTGAAVTTPDVSSLDLGKLAATTTATLAATKVVREETGSELLAVATDIIVGKATDAAVEGAVLAATNYTPNPDTSMLKAIIDNAIFNLKFVDWRFSEAEQDRLANSAIVDSVMLNNHEVQEVKNDEKTQQVVEHLSVLL